MDVSHKPTYRHVVKGDASHVVVGAALPRVVEPETERAGVPPLKRDVLPKRAVLHVDGPVIDLHSSYGEVAAGGASVRTVSLRLEKKSRRQKCKMKVRRSYVHAAWKGSASEVITPRTPDPVVGLRHPVIVTFTHKE